MATPAQIAELRLNIKEPNDVAPYTDEFLGGLIDQYGINIASSKMWIAKAASVINLVDVSEGGSSRKMSELHKNYLALAQRFEDDDAPPSVDTFYAPRTRRAERI